jgi:hypothetical protein
MLHQKSGFICMRSFSLFFFFSHSSAVNSISNISHRPQLHSPSLHNRIFALHLISEVNPTAPSHCLFCCHTGWQTLRPNVRNRQTDRQQKDAKDISFDADRKMIMNYKCMGVWKTVVLAVLRVLSKNSYGDREDSYKTHHQGRWCSV